MSKKSLVLTKVTGALVLSVSMVALFGTYLTQTVSAQIAKESSFRVSNNASCVPGKASEETVHFSGCSSLI